MLILKAIRAKRQHMLGRALVVGSALVFAPVRAHAHFILVTPDAWMSQDSLGLPEKLGPCGNEGGGTPTGKVTVFQAGQTIAVTINEVARQRRRTLPACASATAAGPRRWPSTISSRW